MPPETSLSALTRRLGHRNAQVREDAARALHEHGSLGLDALLDAWEREQRWRLQRGIVGTTAFVLLIVGGFWAIHFGHPSNTEAMWGCFAMLGGMIADVCFMLPTRRQREVAAALIAYDDPRALPYLAQALSVVTTDDPRRAQLITKLRGILQEQPDHTLTFPGTKNVLRWQPERTRRPIYPFWLWLCVTLFTAPLLAMTYVFFLTSWLNGGTAAGFLSNGIAMPILVTFLASQARSVLREDVTYARRTNPTKHRWRYLIGAAIVIALTGILTHFVRGQRPSWPAVVWASLGVPACWWLSNLAGKRAMPEPPEKQA